MMTRPEYLIERYPTLMSSEREARLPKWAQAKLADLRLLLMQEASKYEDALEVIEQMESGHHN
ncbi:hypothetical protein SEA_CAELUM_55 [Streptomyces phage Caelum]|uniref:Uncharacterized protein n=1 Tax=Streptomyces phage Caelum TaxID=2530160 RepID=A0A481W076_9CAUD|nr:hypothetical protein KGG86_gp55 [Streptomyces phage Caelum]QBI99415.1 hypothetical protein SEA_CAELUM_55 [Streptomyces phage Caelum]